MQNDIEKLMGSLMNQGKMGNQESLEQYKRWTGNAHDAINKEIEKSEAPSLIKRLLESMQQGGLQGGVAPSVEDRRKQEILDYTQQMQQKPEVQTYIEQMQQNELLKKLELEEQDPRHIPPVVGGLEDWA
jgi:hypothetical protein